MIETFALQFDAQTIIIDVIIAVIVGGIVSGYFYNKDRKKKEKLFHQY